MKKNFLRIDRQKFTGILSALVFLAAGILLLMRPALLTDLSVWFLGALLAGLALYWCVRYFRSSPEEGARSYDLAEALISLSLSLVLFLRRDLFDAALPMLWGALLVIGGFMILQTAVDFLRMKISVWWIMLTGAAVALALGALALLHPAFLEDRMSLYVGISLIVVAAVNLVSLILLFLHAHGKLNAKPKEKKPEPPAAQPESAAPAAPAAEPAKAPAPAAEAAPAAGAPETPAPAAPEPPKAAPATIFEELAQYAEEDKKKGTP